MVLPSLDIVVRVEAKYLLGASVVQEMRQRLQNRVEAFCDGFGASGKIDDDGGATDAGGLTREHGGWHLCDGSGAHDLTNAGDELLANCSRGLGGDVAWGRARTTSGEDKAAGGGKGDDGLLDGGLVVGNYLAHCCGGDEVGRDVRLDGRAAAVFVLAAEGAVRDGEDSDDSGGGVGRFGHSEEVGGVVYAVDGVGLLRRPLYNDGRLQCSALSLGALASEPLDAC